MYLWVLSPVSEGGKKLRISNLIFSLAVLQYEEAGRRYLGTGRTGHEYSSTDTWPYHSVSPCQVWQYGADS